MIDPDIVDSSQVRMFAGSIALAYVASDFHEFVTESEGDNVVVNQKMGKRLAEMANWVADTFLIALRMALENGSTLTYDHDFRGVGEHEGDVFTVAYETAIMSDEDFMEHYQEIIHGGIMITLNQKKTQEKLVEILLNTKQTGEA